MKLAKLGMYIVIRHDTPIETNQAQHMQSRCTIRHVIIIISQCNSAGIYYYFDKLCCPTSFAS